MHTIQSVSPKVLKILREKPTLPYSIIANDLGVTRERVRQIAKENGYPPRQNILKPKICHICGESFHIHTRNLYCSPICRHKARYTRIAVNCHQCGEQIERTPGNMRSKSGKYFCNRVCFGRCRDLS